MDIIPAEIARAYFDALSACGLDAAVAGWRPGTIDPLAEDGALP